MLAYMIRVRAMVRATQGTENTADLLAKSLHRITFTKHFDGPGMSIRSATDPLS